ncbi:T9SS type A sorting domain-containing protein [Neolewinella litorea]|uniref:T9SS type A sorting domain-containing protein n=1 Tax=Neolewinella litorea TaxID=2562452 RepID=A0A4S4NQD8_9BACT|nr:T9SS type A sorting domain-containing protein [Neolewinella litorea]THH41355.1 T9SS type A sorting domain-containing protein [Neolewinella litorea]
MNLLSGTPTCRVLLRASLIILFFPFSLYSQTFTGNVTLTTQAELDGFTSGGSPYTQVEGNLTLDATGTITDLTNLASLTSITGTLTITNWGADDTAPDSNPLGAFSALTTVGNLQVGTSAVAGGLGLTNIGSDGLAQVAGHLVVENCPALATARFPSLTQTGGDLNLSELPQLDYFSGPVLGTVGGQLRLNELDDLINLDSLPSLSSIGTRLIIRGNDNLTTLDGLSAGVSGGATFILEELSIEFNPYLSTIEALDAEVTDRFTLGYNNNLFLLSDRIAFGNTMSSIKIYNNLAIEDLSVIFDGLSTVNISDFEVYNNASLIQIGDQDFNVTNSILFSGNYSVPSLPNFSSTTAITGDLTITNNLQLTETNSLRNLTTVGGGVTLKDNDSFTTTSAMINTQPASALTGFGSLERAAFLVFEGNDGMENLDDFTSLTVLDNSLRIANNGSLGDCCQLPCQVVVNGTSFDTYNDAVTVINNTGICADKPAIRNNCAGMGCASAAPVRWLSFTVRPGKTGMDLVWTTTAEWDHDRFIVERSADGVAFRSIAEVRHGQVTPEGTTYRFRDEQFIPGYNYYRIRQVDTDGSFSYSEVVELMSESSDGTPHIYPNPVRSGQPLIVTVPAGWSGATVMLEMRSASGQPVVIRRLIRPGSKIEMETDGLVPGLYLVRISDRGHWVSKRVVVR